MGTLANAERKVEYVKIAKKGPNKKAELISVGLTFIASVLLIVFAVVPTVKTVGDINKDIKEKQRISSALESKIKALSSLDTQYNKEKDVFNDITLIFPTSQNFSLFLANIDAIVTRNNFYLNSIGFSETKSSRDSTDEKNLSVLKPYSIRLSVTGSKLDLINFLKDLEALPMYPVIETISFSSDVDENGNTDFSIGLGIYHVDNVNFYD